MPLIRDARTLSNKAIGSLRVADAVHSARSVGLDRDRIRRERDRLLDPAMISNLENRPKFP